MSRETENTKKNQMLMLEWKSTMTEVKNSLDGFSNISRFDIQESVSEDEDKSRETIQSDEHRGKKD